MSKGVQSRAKTTETSFRIIDALRESDGATMAELSERLDLSPSTVHRHLVTLRERSFVTYDGTEYRIGLQFLTIGGYAQRQITGFSEIKKKVDALAEQTDDRVQFIVEENGERVYIYTKVGQSSVYTGASTGRRGPIHTSAAGKAILAEYPRAKVESIIEQHGLPPVTEHCLTTPEALFTELDEISERGYAVNKQETTKGVHAVGAVITDAENKPIGALSVSGPASRMKEDRLHNELPELILGAVNELELYIEHGV